MKRDSCVKRWWYVGFNKNPGPKPANVNVEG